MFLFSSDFHSLFLILSIELFPNNYKIQIWNTNTIYKYKFKYKHSRYFNCLFSYRSSQNTILPFPCTSHSFFALFLFKSYFLSQNSLQDSFAFCNFLTKLRYQFAIHIVISLALSTNIIAVIMNIVGSLLQSMIVKRPPALYKSTT